MRRVVQLLLICIVLCGSTELRAQFGGLGKKIKDKVTNRAKERGEDLALQKLAELRGEYDPTECNYAIALSDNAGLFENTERYERHKKALYMVATKNQERSLEEQADGLNDAGEMFYANEKFRVAEIYLLGAMIAYADIGMQETTKYGDVLANLGLLYHTTGRYSLSEDFSVKAIKLRRKLMGKESIPFAASMNNLAVLRKDQGDFNKAETQIETVLEITTNLQGTDNMPYAIALNNKAIIYQTVGRAEEAVPLLRQAIEIAGKVLSEESGNYQRLMVNLALLHQDLEQYSEAEAIYLQAIRYKEQRFGKQHPDYAHMLSHLASLYMEMGKGEEVEPLLQEALSIFKAKFGVNHPSYATAASNLGNYYRVAGKLEEASPLLLQAHEVRQKQLGDQNPAFVKSEEDLALLYWAKGDVTQARTHFTQSLDQSLEFITTYFPPMSEREKARYWDKLKPRFQRFAAFALDHYEQQPALATQLFNYHLMTKGILLNSSNRIRETILASGDQELIDLYLQWIDQKENLARLYTYSREQLITQKINLDSLEQEANKSEKSLSAKSKVFEEGLFDEAVTFAAVSSHLQAGQAAVELVHVPAYREAGTSDANRYAALIVKPGLEMPELVRLDNGDQLEGRYYKYYNNAIKQKIADEYSYAQYWEPISQKLGSSQQVFVSLDGVYHQISLSTLRKANGNYVLDDRLITVVGSSRELLQEPLSPPAGASSALMVGFPTYGTAGTVSPLPGTRTEVTALEQLLQERSVRTTLLTGQEANEENLKQVDNPTILHIATHGFFLQNLSSKEEKVFGVDVEKARENPLLRSGLMLAGAEDAVANRQNQDDGANNGILTAYEAMNMDLQQTDMVILSACETGLGDVVSGEGVYGLQRSFLVAGANSVIMSLWKVDDAATQELMTSFYRNWLASGDKKTAFRQAQLQLKQRYAEPYYWGAFVLIGS